ncbi:MAG: D-alanyl-D-alanine carboxypeptidase family protein [Xanthomonadaceae bacterium]|jgi:D-alanyl-D-alanine carboxypeptidase|nr:D-alanyl-D-alanine carboxypeptidase family protein [Xanthomonadaceae bacterium]
MKPAPRYLINTTDIELWPASLRRARSNADARILSRADWLLRRKRDGRYLAAVIGAEQNLMPLVTRLAREPGIDEALDRLDNMAALLRHLAHGQDADDLPIRHLRQRLDALGIEASAYMARTGLPLHAEPQWLMFAGHDRYRRPLWLTAAAARAWSHMRHAASDDGIALEAISGYRSHAYQAAIFERKRSRGQIVDGILKVNAAPGFSEHHTGNALDISAPGEPPVDESFETTAAFAWLQRNADGHGFRMSFPRDNPHGVVYEPWHWHHETAQ